MSSMITFAANNEFFRKRKRVHKACDHCKKRRKRCVHTFDGDDSGATYESPAGATAAAPSPRVSAPDGPDARRPANTNATDAPAPEPAQDPPPPPRRFIGYLNPEAVMRGQLRESDNQVGGWVQAADDDAEPLTTSGKNAQGTSSGPSSSVARALPAYLEAAGVYIEPDERHLESMCSIYFEYVNPLLPLVDQRSFYLELHGNKGSRMLRQAMCLVASRHEGVRQHLYLSNSTDLLEPRDYARRLYGALVAGVNARLEKNRITLIRILALMSLYSEGIDGADQASMHLVQAIHHAHTIGLHLDRQQSTDKLFWCLWSLDKVNASVSARPLYMHDRDNMQVESLTATPDQRRTPFGIWLQLAGVLDRVIGLYRPGTDPANTGIETDFPGFEDIIGDGGDRLRGPIVAALELFYHAVSMLSHKSRSITDPVARSTPSAVRQTLSAYRVISILSHEFPTDLPPVPIVPYALALAMSVAYRQFRRSKLQGHKLRAKHDLKTCCALLGRLRATWWCAGCMADLGKAALVKADKAMEQQQQPQTHQLAAPVYPGRRTSQHFREDDDGNDDTASDRTLPLLAQQPPQQQQQPPTSAPAPAPFAIPTLLAPQPQPQQQQQQQTHPYQRRPRPPTSADNTAGSTTLNSTTAPTTTTAPAASSNTSGSPCALLSLSDENSPDWLNFDAAFENMDALLGSGAAAAAGVGDFGGGALWEGMGMGVGDGAGAWGDRDGVLGLGFGFAEGGGGVGGAGSGTGREDEHEGESALGEGTGSGSGSGAGAVG
ncbi:uncharacterized protein K452DRAFT_356443 [Aplosporella prunicola CBS 121167]|uniref:Xylanolytic transcriptional activator regulatory domain-containing protein n=1 Tax=Aplosporella prunicola CBS 121167 TaxID=1176127 RepID=A0A6A6BNW6_9PEZI|nr:uncharacterized protein K452DRAFT_356443 [Aplosporella prunicola CBS 121167]KAF2145133.1 hypothetical protein K452DRAFT_356443 [Aplosporella prunicola CBS 121167]